MHFAHKFSFKWLFLITLLIMASCEPKSAIFLEPWFQFSSIDRIILLPPVDARIDKKIKVNLQKQLLEKTEKILRKKGYQVGQSDVIGEVGEIVEEDLKDAKSEWIQRLGPAEAHWIMVLCLVDVTSKLTFGSTGNAEITGYLYDKKAGKMIWRNKGVSQVGQGGLVGVVLKSGMDESAISLAIYELLKSIPKRQK